MKKIILSLTALLISLSFFANEKAAGFLNQDQDNDADYFLYQPKKIRYGFYLAPSIDWMKSKESSQAGTDFKTTSLGSQIGLKLGITVDYGVKNGFGVSSGIHYNNTQGHLLTHRVGGNNLQPSTVDRADIAYKVGFFEVPLNIRYTSPDLVEHFRFFGSAGVGISFTIHKQAAMTLNYVNSSSVQDAYQQDYEPLKGWLSIAPISMLWNAGLGAEYDIDYKRTIYLGVFYQNNFLPDMTNHKRFGFPVGDLTFHDGNVRWNHIALRLGVVF